jgi:hypothetical protein
MATAPVTDPELLAYFEHCVEFHRRELPRNPEEQPPRFDVVLSDDQPQYRVRERRIILQRGSNWWQLRSQAGHEVFHWWATPGAGDIYHWSHELIAQEMSIRCIESASLRPREGLKSPDEYIRATEDQYRAEAGSTSLQKMLTTAITPPYEWVRGRAFVTGRELESSVGWGHLKNLATYFTDEQVPDVRRWLADLPRPDRRRAMRVLGRPDVTWV